MSYYVAQQPMYMPVQQPMMQVPIMAQQQQQFMQAPVQYVPMMKAPVTYKQEPVTREHTVEQKAKLSNKSLHGGSRRMLPANQSIEIRDKMGRKFTLSVKGLCGGSRRVESPLKVSDIVTREKVRVSRTPLSHQSKVAVNKRELLGGKIIKDKFGRRYMLNTSKLHKNSVEIPRANKFTGGSVIKDKYGKTFLLNTNKMHTTSVPVMNQKPKEYFPMVGGNLTTLGQPVYMTKPQTQSNLYFTPAQPSKPMFYAPTY